MTAEMSPAGVVRAFFDCYSNGRPQDFDQVVAPDCVDYGHTPPGLGPGGARDDYENAVKRAGGSVSYDWEWGNYNPDILRLNGKLRMPKWLASR